MRKNSFWDHVEELRKSILRMGFVIACATIVAFFFHKPLFQLLLAPLNKSPFEKQVLVKERYIAHQETAIGDVHLKPGEIYDVEVPRKQFYLFSPIDGFLAVLKVSFWAGILLSSPFWTFFLLQFILPALRHRERSVLLPFFGLSLFFIGGGILFAYTVTLPIVSRFFEKFNEAIAENLWGLGQTLDFALILILAHGLVFELYVGLLFLIHFRVLTTSQLIRARRVAMVLILILAAILTPPDLISQLLIAIPMLLLYETTIFYAHYRERRKKDSFPPFG